MKNSGNYSIIWKTDLIENKSKNRVVTKGYLESSDINPKNRK